MKKTLSLKPYFPNLKTKLKPSDQALFRHAMRGVKPLVAAKDKVIASPAAPAGHAISPRKKSAARVNPALPSLYFVHDHREAPDSFSDVEFLDPVGSEAMLEFAGNGISAKTMRRLRQGKEPIEAVLDLHGKIVAAAREALEHFLQACEVQGKVQVLIIHGKGRAHMQPILKNKLNHWLRHSSQVLAFCSAKPQDGGRGALYVRLKRGR
jgi:DNA-nicking Smr family endonuclease